MRLNDRGLRRAKHATDRLFLHFQNQHAEIAHYLGISRQKVAEWMLRGYVSALAALVFDELRIPGASKHDLRPDVVDWDRIKEQHLAMARANNADAYPDL